MEDCVILRGEEPGGSLGKVTFKGSKLHAGGSGAFSDNDCFENKNSRLAPDLSVVDKIECCCW